MNGKEMSNGWLCKEHSEELKKIHDKVDEHSEELKKIHGKVSEIKLALCGGLKNGKYYNGYLSRQKWVERVQKAIISIMIAILVGISLIAIKYVPVFLHAAEIIGD